MIVGVAGIIGLGGLAGAATSVSVSKKLSVSGVQGKDVVDITPSDAACSQETENCFFSGCCKVTGHKCFKKWTGLAWCNATCTPGVQGFTDCQEVSHPSMPATWSPGTALYCFAVYTENTGSTKPSTELDLLKLQRKYDASIFGCEGKDVFADVQVDLGKGTKTIQVFDTHNEFHQVKRKETGSWVNWAMFYQVWVKIRELGHWHDYDYTVKVDPDSVFLPGRMRDWLQGKKDTVIGWLRGKPATDRGVYYANCRNVKLDFFGSLEVMTNKAIAVLTSNLEDCHRLYAPWCANHGCGWTPGGWGEDVWAQRCMDRNHVGRVHAFDITTDGACEADRPEGQKKNQMWHATDCSSVMTPAMHPYKKPAEYFECLGQIMRRDYQV